MGMDQQQFPMFSSTPSGNQLFHNFSMDVMESESGSELNFDMRDMEYPEPIYIESSKGITCINVKLGLHRILNIVCEDDQLPPLNIYSPSYVCLHLWCEKTLFVSKISGSVSEINHENDLRIGILEVNLDCSQSIVRVFDRCDKVFLDTGYNKVVFIDRFPRESIEIKVPKCTPSVYVLLSERRFCAADGNCIFLGKKCSFLNYCYYHGINGIGKSLREVLDAPCMKLRIAGPIPTTSRVTQPKPSSKEFEIKVSRIEDNPVNVPWAEMIFTIVHEYFRVKLLSESCSFRTLAPLNWFRGRNGREYMINYAIGLMTKFNSHFGELFAKCAKQRDEKVSETLFEGYVHDLFLEPIFYAESRKRKCEELPELTSASLEIICQPVKCPRSEPSDSPLDGAITNAGLKRKRELDVAEEGFHENKKNKLENNLRNCLGDALGGALGDALTNATKGVKRKRELTEYLWDLGEPDEKRNKECLQTNAPSVPQFHNGSFTKESGDHASIFEKEEVSVLVSDPSMTNDPVDETPMDINE
jgi:hypothetical protein